LAGHEGERPHRGQLEGPAVTAGVAVAVTILWPLHTTLVGGFAGVASTSRHGRISRVDRQAAGHKGRTRQQRMGEGKAPVTLQQAQPGILA
jgi:hypothetical protein